MKWNGDTHAHRSRNTEPGQSGHVARYGRTVHAGGGSSDRRRGGGLGFNGGQLLYLAVAGCISNGLFREARAAGIGLSSLRVMVGGDFVGDPAVSDEILYEVEVEGEAPEERLRDLVDHVDEIAEIPNSLRQGTRVRLAGSSLTGN